MNIIYFGFNSFNQHKRGIENVIQFQSRAAKFENIYYVHWAERTKIYKYGKFICISIKKCWYWPIILNFVIVKIYKKRKPIIHSHNYLFSFFSIINTDIFTVHDGLYYLKKAKKCKNLIVFKAIEYITYLRCKKVQFISNYTKEQSLYPRNREYIIVYNTSYLEPLIKNSCFKFKQEDIFNILIVRSIEERARIDLIFEVAKKINDPNIQFTIVGKGPLLEFYIKKKLKMKIIRI